MRKWVVLVWRNGLGKGSGEVLGHYRTQEDAEADAVTEEDREPETVASVYELVA